MFSSSVNSAEKQILDLYSYMLLYAVGIGAGALSIISSTSGETLQIGLWVCDDWCSVDCSLVVVYNR